jgi:hypothetical protein
MRSGSSMAALLTGKLKLVDGYLRVGDTIIIWQTDYFVHDNDGIIEIWDRDGNVVGRVGEEIMMGGGSAGTLEWINPMLKEPVPADVKGPFWLQASSGTRLSLNFNSEYFYLDVITSGDNEVYFLRRKLLLDETVNQEVSLTGKLQANYDGLIFRNPVIYMEDKPEEHKPSVRYTPFWPAGYSARITTDGVFEVLDGEGKVVIRGGEEISVTGKAMYGYYEELHDQLPGEFFQPYLIVESVQ